MAIKFLHTADIHLDSPLLNLDQYDGAPVEAFRSATRRAFDNIVELAVDRQVEFILIAGDLYDGDCRDFNTPLYFRRRMEELKSCGIRVFLCQGNHDAQSNMRKAFRMQLPDNVHLFPTGHADTVRLDDLRVAIHGQGFAQREVEHDLSPGYPDAIPGWVNFGLLHTSCGVYESHACYAPSTVAGLTRKGYQYWALGHIHKREQLAFPDPWIVYPGIPQGRHIRETGPHGCVIGEIENGHITLEWHLSDVLRWELCQVDVHNCQDPEAIVLRAEGEIASLLDSAEGRPLAVRLVVTGGTPAHAEWTRHQEYWGRQIRESVVDRFDQRVWIEKIQSHTHDVAERPSDGERRGGGVVAGLLSGIDDPLMLRAAVADVRDDLERLVKSLPTDPRCPDAFDLDDRCLSRCLHDARELLAGKLTGKETDAK